MRVARTLLAGLVLATFGCGDEAPASTPPPELRGEVDFAAIEAAYEACLDGDTDAGVEALDAVIATSGGAPDALATRGLCRWARWGETEDPEEVRAAYEDLTAAIETVEGGAEMRGSDLDVLYSQRAFVAQALDGAWVRTLEDLSRAIALDPDDARHVLDRGVVRSYVGDTLAARADLEQYLAMSDSADVSDPAQRRVVETLLEDLEPAPDLVDGL